MVKKEEKELLLKALKSRKIPDGSIALLAIEVL